MGSFPMVTTSTYLDHASATPLDERARTALVAALDEFADPLRVHGDGLAARRLLDDARATVAGALRAQPDEIVFTSGGTESVALAIWGGVRPVRELGTRIVTTTVEHPAVGGVLHTLETDGFESVLVEVDGDGSVDLDAFAAEIRRPGTLLASVHHANHEVGTIQPIAECARLCREAGVLFHTDACQTVGHLPVDAVALDVDLLSISGHKFGGPPGIGALYVRRGVPIAAYPCGDDRERRRRSGVENVPGVAAMAAALETRLEGMNDEVARGWALTDAIRAGIPAAARRRGRHPARRTFQAIRMEVNRELPNLAAGLDESVHLLTPGGRILVIAYHSLEDRLVKRRFATWAGRDDPEPPGMPVARPRNALVRLLTRRPRRPDADEVAENPRSASARLRAAEKVRES